MNGLGGHYKSDKHKYCVITLTCGILKIQQISEYNRKEADSQISENKQVVTSGEMGTDREIGRAHV